MAKTGQLDLPITALHSFAISNGRVDSATEVWSSTRAFLHICMARHGQLDLPITALHSFVLRVVSMHVATGGQTPTRALLTFA